MIENMQKTPKSLRLQIGLFGRANVGKSSFLNYVSGQDVAITSPVPGTTTDVVEKAMELLPLGPVMFLDTAGLDDTSVLSDLRIKKTKKIFDRADVIVLLTEPNAWSIYEDEVFKEAHARKIPVIVVVNKIDQCALSDSFLEDVKKRCAKILLCSCLDKAAKDSCVAIFKKYLIEACPDEFLNPHALISDLLIKEKLAVLIVPIDLEAPKGRLILPQVQAIRDALDGDAAVMVVKEHEYRHHLDNLKVRPDIVVCDSQVVDKMVTDTPEDIRCTTFSILFSRFKGDLVDAARGVAVIDQLKPGDKILIAEACSHHPIEGDIGRVKIPAWLKKYAGFDVNIEVSCGRDFPENLSEYKLVIHCGACMLTRREMWTRIQKAREASVALTNYGVCIAFLRGVIERVLLPFPEALVSYRETRHQASTRSKENSCRKP